MKRIILIALALVALQACKKKEIDYLECYCCDKNGVIKMSPAVPKEMIDLEGGVESVIDHTRKSFCPQFKLHYCGYDIKYKE